MFGRCGKCRRLSLRKTCGRCRRAAEKQKVNGFYRQNELQRQCLGELRDLVREGSDAEAAVNALIEAYEHRGLVNGDILRREFLKSKAMAWIGKGNLPIIGSPGITLAPGETAHFIFPATRLYQRRVVDRQVSTQFAGLSSGFMFGEAQSQIQEQTGDVLLGDGRLVLTSQRLVFSSSGAGINAPWWQITDASPAGKNVNLVVSRPGEVGTPLRLVNVDADLLLACIAALREPKPE